MIKVLQVITELGDGGVEMMLTNLYKEIDKEKIQFIFCVQTDKRSKEKMILDLGGKIIQIIPLADCGMIKYIKQIYTICKKYDVDCIHCHNLLQNIFILFGAKLAGVKKRICHSHLTTVHKQITNYLLPLLRILINYLATDRLACGEEAGRFLYGKKSFKIINNAIDIERFINYQDQKEIQEINQKFGDNIILHVGRLSGQKNHEYLIKIAKELKNRNIKFKVLCCGDGPLKKSIQNLIDQNNLHNDVKLLGSINNVIPYYYASKIMILPSLYEGLPVVSIEMQASGLQGVFSNTIDKTCDLGLGLINFLGIEDSNVSEWVDTIVRILNTNTVIDKDRIYNILNKKGYNVKSNTKSILDIYLKE